MNQQQQDHHNATQSPAQEFPWPTDSDQRSYPDPEEDELDKASFGIQIDQVPDEDADDAGYSDAENVRP